MQGTPGFDIGGTSPRSLLARIQGPMWVPARVSDPGSPGETEAASSVFHMDPISHLPSARHGDRWPQTMSLVDARRSDHTGLMFTTSVTNVNARLNELLRRFAEGETVIILDRGRPNSHESATAATHPCRHHGAQGLPRRARFRDTVRGGLGPCSSESPTPTTASSARSSANPRSPPTSRRYLPVPIAARLDLSTVAPQPDTFIDPDLSEYHSDLLLRVGLRGGGEAWIHILLEHKSYEDRLVTVQLLRYLVRVWDRDARDRASPAWAGRTADAIDSDDAADAADGDDAADASDTESRPPRPVIPILLYHGQQPWNAPTRLSELFDGPEELRPYWPELQVLLVDLTAIPEEAIVGEVRLRVVLLVMRAIWSPDLGQRLPGILALLRDVLEQPTAMGTLQVVLRYVAHSSAVITEAEMRHAVDAALPEPGGESMTTLVEQWLEQGRQEGLQRGRQEGQQEGLRKGLHQGLHEAIELGLAQRFGDAGHDVTALAARIRAVEDGDALRDILRTVWVAASLDQVRQALE